MDVRQKHYTISQFAKMGNTSARQLRYLEEKGVLVPEMRDRDNKYRYYTYDQLNQLVQIKTLRDLGISFENIVEIFQKGEFGLIINVMRRRLDEAGRNVQKAMMTYQQVLHYCTQLSDADRILLDFNSGDEEREEITIRLVDVPMRMAVSTRYNSNTTAWEPFVDRFLELQQICRDMELVISGGMYAIFHDGCFKQFEGGAEDLEVLFPISTQTVRAPGFRWFGGFQAVSAVYKGHYKDMKALYEDMHRWADEHHIRIMDVAVENYILGPDVALHPALYVTQVFIPLEGSSI